VRFGELLNKGLLRAEMTKGTLATRIGKPKAYISDWACSRRPPPQLTIVNDMADVLEITPRQRRDLLRGALKERTSVKFDSDALTGKQLDELAVLILGSKA